MVEDIFPLNWLICACLNRLTIYIFFNLIAFKKFKFFFDFFFLITRPKADAVILLHNKRVLKKNKPISW